MLIKSSKLIGTMTKLEEVESINSKTIKVGLSLEITEVERGILLIKYDSEVAEYKNDNLIMNKSAIYEVKYDEYADVQQVVDEHKAYVMEYITESIHMDLQQSGIILNLNKEMENTKEKELNDFEKKYN